MTVDLFIGSQRSRATQINYALDLKKWFTYLGDRVPTQEIALGFRNVLQETMAPASAARIFNTCRTFYRWERLDNPFEYIPTPKTVVNQVPKVPSDEAVDSLVRMCSGDKRDSAIVALLLNGLRSEEVTRLTTADWEYVEAYQTYVLKVIGKGQKARIVPANDDSVKAVSDYLPIRNRGSAWLIQARSGDQLTTRQVQYVVEKYSGGQLRPHALRHHYATRLIRNGAGIFAVQPLLGHSSIRTTQVYVSLDLADIIKEARKDPRNKEKK